MAESTGGGSSTDLIANATIADVDVHVISGLPDEEVEKHLDRPHRGWLSNPRTGIMPERDPYMQGKIEPRTISGPEQLEDELRGDFHVDYPIINPFAGLAKYHQRDLATALMSAYNRTMVDLYLDPTDDIYGMIELAPQQPDKAAEEIDDWADEDKVVGAWILSAGPQPPLGDPVYDVMYEAAEDNGLPIAFHGAGPGAFVREFQKQDRGLQRLMSVHTLAHPWNQMLTLTSLTVQGTFEKFPDLDFVFLEAGIGWLPYTMYRLNSEYGMRRMEAPLLEKNPEEYIRDHCYVSTQPLGEPQNPAHMQQLIDMVGADSIMFATDYPHWDFDHPDGLDRHLRMMFDDDERDQVLHGNANEVFGLGI